MQFASHRSAVFLLQGLSQEGRAHQLQPHLPQKLRSALCVGPSNIDPHLRTRQNALLSGHVQVVRAGSASGAECASTRISSCKLTSAKVLFLSLLDRSAKSSAPALLCKIIDADTVGGIHVKPSCASDTPGRDVLHLHEVGRHGHRLGGVADLRAAWYM